MRPTELRNFIFTKSFLIERVTWPGRSKEFVRDFRKTCRLLKKNPHPARVEGAPAGGNRQGVIG